MYIRAKSVTKSTTFSSVLTELRRHDSVLAFCSRAAVIRLFFWAVFLGMECPLNEMTKNKGTFAFTEPS